MYVAWDVVLHFILNEMITNEVPSLLFSLLSFSQRTEGFPACKFPGGGSDGKDTQ